MLCVWLVCLACGRSERDEVFKFQIGFENVIAGWDLGVATMKKGERAAFR